MSIIRRCLMALGGAAAVLGLLVAAPLPASAHVILRDGEAGAVLHIAPGDDPVAGLVSGLFYEIKAPGSLAGADTTLTILRQNNPAEIVPTHLKGDTVAGEYTFPVRNIYTLKLVVRQIGVSKPLIFTHVVRVSRAIKGTAQAVPAPVWAKVGLLLSAWGMLVCVGVFLTRRKTITSK